MAVAQRIDPATYERLAVHDGYRFVELRDGVLVEKPPVTFRHAWTIDRLAHELHIQLDPEEFTVSSNNARLRVGDSYVVPDLVVLPAVVVEAMLELRPDRLAVFDDPVPLVVEVWSPSIGGYDMETKLPLYQARGDREIWRPHPIERTLTTSVRGIDGSYAETIHTVGIVECAALPGVRVDLGALFG